MDSVCIQWGLVTPISHSLSQVPLDHPKLLLFVLGLSILSYARARRLPVDGPNRKSLLHPLNRIPRFIRNRPLLAFACLLSSTLSVPGQCHRIKTPNTLEARFDLPILGSLDGFTEVHLDSSRANMPLMHKAVWHLLNHIEFVARRHAHKEKTLTFR